MAASTENAGAIAEAAAIAEAEFERRSAADEKHEARLREERDDMAAFLRIF